MGGLEELGVEAGQVGVEALVGLVAELVALVEVEYSLDVGVV